MNDNIIPYLEIKVVREEGKPDVLDVLAQSEAISGTLEEDDHLLLYIPLEDKAGFEMIATRLKEEGLPFSIRELEPTNWNAEWEKSFEPVRIENSWQIVAPFHQKKKGFRFTIEIEPKMAFGTGHHATTRLMLQRMQHLQFDLRRVLDLGCGSGILAIAAEKLGAAAVTAIDHDPLSVESTIENAGKNDCTKISAVLGQAEHTEGLRYEIILANINRNVILGSISAMEDLLLPGGNILLSGFLEKDVAAILESSNHLSIVELTKDPDSDWVCLHMIKDIPLTANP